MALKELLIGSNNQDKIKEIKSILHGIASELYTPSEWMNKNKLPEPPNPVEDGKTYLENALIKARSFYRWAGVPVISDDTGLEVEFLDNQPGIYAARFAGEYATYQDNIEKILYEMQGAVNRRARFIATIALSFDEESYESFTGEISGVIAAEASGEAGFGYDPVFYPDGFPKTLAELKPEGNVQTHRVMALNKLKEFLKNKHYAH